MQTLPFKLRTTRHEEGRVCVWHRAFSYVSKLWSKWIHFLNFPSRQRTHEHFDAEWTDGRRLAQRSPPLSFLSRAAVTLNEGSVHTVTKPTRHISRQSLRVETLLQKWNLYFHTCNSQDSRKTGKRRDRRFDSGEMLHRRVNKVQLLPPPTSMARSFLSSPK